MSTQHFQTIAAGIECEGIHVGKPDVLEVRLNQYESVNLDTRKLERHRVAVEVWQRSESGDVPHDPMTLQSPEQSRALADALLLASDALGDVLDVELLNESRAETIDLPRCPNWCVTDVGAQHAGVITNGRTSMPVSVSHEKWNTLSAEELLSALEHLQRCLPAAPS